MNNKECNGWTNYETWVINMFFDNENEKADAENFKGETYDYAQTLKEDVEQFIPELDSPFSDLLNAALSEVNWFELAKSFLNRTTEE